MQDLISFYFKGLFLLLTDSVFRTFTWLFLTGAFKKRYKEYTLSVNGYRIHIADIKSFIWQYYEIFFHNFYAFNTTSEQPVIYDCGANIGTSVLFFSKKHPKARIVAYEASPYIYSMLKKNVEANGIQNAVLHQNAVWINNETLEFNDEGADSGSIHSIANSKKIKVQAIDFLEALNKESKIDMLKIDIEGAEAELIPHIAPALHKVEKIFLEYHTFPGKKQNLDTILLILTQNNFRYYIRHANNRKAPFIDTAKDKDMDMQLNIFAYRN